MNDEPRRALRRKRGAAAWLVLFAVAGGCTEPAGQRAAYLLNDRAGSALAVEGDEPLRVSFVEIGFDQRRALMQRPSVYRFDGVPSGEGAVFSAAPVLGPPAWGSASDGVDLAVRCAAPSGGWQRLLSVELRPEGSGPPSGWHEREVALTPCSSPTTSLQLETTCGPRGDCRRDWTAWGNPRVLHPLEVRPQVDRLVLLISIDTLRPDRLSLYGAERPTSPHLAELAADAVVFEMAVAPTPWTIPSHASLLTSTDPGVHGATGNRDIRPQLPLLSEVLKTAGWTTAGFVDTPWLGSFGFDRGYDHYDAETPPPGSFRRGAESTRERIVDWLPEATGDLFVFWHLMDVHGPYGAPAPYGGRFRDGVDAAPAGVLAELGKLEYHNYLRLGRFRNFDDLVAAYDEGILHADADIGRLLELLKQAGLYEDALIVVTSDHGESLMDHGVWVGHGLFLTEDEIRIPLLVKLPGNRFAGTRVERMVRLTDVAPTILDAVGVPDPPSFEGLSLVNPRPGAPAALPRVAFGLSTNTGSRYIRHNRLKMITDWSKTRDEVIEVHLRASAPTALTERLEGGERLFDLLTDPTEQHNLIGAEGRAQQAADLRRHLRFHAQRLGELDRSLTGSAGEAQLSEEQIRQLKSLGYLGGVDR